MVLKDNMEVKNLNKMSLNDVCLEVAANQDLKLDIANNMRQYGGSFVQALAECLVRADRQNTFKLVEAFMSYIFEYMPDKWKGK